MALEKPRQQPAHCLFPTCSWALERHGKNYIWIVTHPFHSFVGGFWRLTPADLTWCGMMRKDVVCWACWFLVLVCWCFCFVLEVARCMGLLKRTQLSVFIFVAEVSAKCGPRSGTRNTLSMCATANLGIRVGHTTIGARVEQVKGFLRKDLGMIWPFWDDSGRLGVCRVFQISWLATTLQDSSSVTFCRGIGVHPLIALCGTEDNGSSPILCRELWRTYSQNLVQSDHIYAGHLFFKLAVFKDSEA